MASGPPSPAPTLLRPPSFHPATVEWAPGQQPRFVVVNPMHIITLQARTKTFAVKVVEKIKSFSEKWFSHILLLIFLLIYASLGALLFQWLEGDLEQKEKGDIIRVRNSVINDLWNATVKQSKEAWLELAHLKMKTYEFQVEEHFRSRTADNSETTAWTFFGSLFYCGTVFTTIGYGHIYPATTAGQAATIIYAFIGIPFLLMVLADLGRLFTRAIKAVFYYVKLFYHTGKIRKARRLGRRATAVPVEYMTVAWNKMPYIVYPNRMRKQNSMDITNPDAADVEAGKNDDNPTDDSKPVDNKEKLSDKNVKKKGKKARIAEQEEEMSFEGDAETIKTVVEDNVDDEFNLPVSLAIILLLAYMMLGAAMFSLWEDWSFFESFYFVFVSMSTIGFGDYVPDHPMFMMATFIYLLFGLALTSMCINVIQEKLSATFEMAKLRIGTTIGLDANMIMEEEMYHEKDDTSNGKSASKGGSRRGSKAGRGKTDHTSEGKETEKTSEENQNSEKIKNGLNDKNPPNSLESNVPNHN